MAAIDFEQNRTCQGESDKREPRTVRPGGKWLELKQHRDQLVRVWYEILWATVGQCVG